MKILSVISVLIFASAGCFQHKINATSNSDIPLSIHKDTTVTNFFKRTSGVIAMDGGYSIPLSDNRVLWLFGDSYIDHYDSATGTVPCLFQVRNAALLQPCNNWQWQQTNTLLSTGPGLKNFLKNNPDRNHFIWPSSGIQLGDTVYIFCNSLKNTGKGLGFGSAGPPKWAKIKIPEMKIVGYTTISDSGNFGFGKAFIKDRSGKYVYTYGSKGRAGTLTNDLYIARFSTDNPYTGWTYWNGSSWTSDIRNITAIDSIPGFSWYVCKIKNKYLLLVAEFSLGCDQGKKISAATSDNPTGPFSTLKTIYTINDTLQGHYPFFYGVIAHPEYINNKDELLITYCINV